MAAKYHTWSRRWAARIWLSMALFLLISASSHHLDAQVAEITAGQDDPRLGGSPRSAPAIGGLSLYERTNCPVPTPDGTILYFNSTRRGTRKWAHYDSVAKRFDDDIYYLTKRTSPDTGWSQPVNLGREVNSSRDDGIEAISRDGQTVYFFSLRPRWEQQNGPFFRARIDGTIWSDITGLGGGLTTFFSNRDHTRRFRVYGASISPEGNDFYFATTVNSKTDQQELWVSHRDTSGVWGSPVNLGPGVNAEGRCFSPFIAADNRTLFFASNREGGYGGDDIYMTRRQAGGSWSAPENLGPAINSKKNEGFPSLDPTGKFIYFSTGEGDREDFSIVPTPLPKHFHPNFMVTLKGQILDNLSKTPTDATISIEDLQTGEKIFTATTDRVNGSYSVVLEPGRDYGISISSPQYLFVSDRYTLPKYPDSDVINRTFHLERLRQGERFSVNNIFFATNVRTPRRESLPELGRLLGLMSDNPELRIEIKGHADSVGDSDYNMILSEQRANSIKQYLVNHGIHPDRVTTHGYGSTVPAAPNDTKEGRKQNRRTEFLVLGM